jgi:hypothetical protein
MTFAGARSFVLRSSDQTASQQPLIRKSRYIHEESVASRVQLRNPTTVHDRNVAVLHRACPLYGRQGTGSYLNLDLNLDETYSFLDHYDQKVLRHSLLMPMLRLREQREQPRQLTTSSEPPILIGISSTNSCFLDFPSRPKQEPPPRPGAVRGGVLRNPRELKEGVSGGLPAKQTHRGRLGFPEIHSR